MPGGLWIQGVQGVLDPGRARKNGDWKMRRIAAILTALYAVNIELAENTDYNLRRKCG